MNSEDQNMANVITVEDMDNLIISIITFLTKGVSIDSIVPIHRDLFGTPSADEEVIITRKTVNSLKDDILLKLNDINYFELSVVYNTIVKYLPYPLEVKDSNGNTIQVKVIDTSRAVSEEERDHIEKETEEVEDTDNSNDTSDCEEVVKDAE